MGSNHKFSKIKTNILHLIAAIGILSNAFALPMGNGAVLYHAMPYYYGPESMGQQRLMYIQYMHPGHGGQGRVRAINNGGSTFISADAIGSGTFVKDQQEHVIYDSSLDAEQSSSFENSQRKNVQHQQQDAISIAETYPGSGAISIEDDFNSDSATDAPAPGAPAAAVTEYHLVDEDRFDSNLPESPPEYEDVNTISSESDSERHGKSSKNFNSYSEYDDTTNSYAAAAGLTEQYPGAAAVTQYPIIGNSQTHIAPPPPHNSYVPSKYLPPRRKIRVELEMENQNDDDESDDDEDQPQQHHPHQHHHFHQDDHPVNSNPNIKGSRPRPPPTPSKRPTPTATKRPVRPRPPQNPQSFPPGTFFPVSFGGPPGGAVAIANSYSTGEGGSATSHATAYGTPGGHTYSRKRVI